MYEPHLVNEWTGLVGSLVMLAIIVTAFGLMLGIVKLEDALKRIGAIAGIVIALMLIPAILISFWSGMSLGQRVGVAAVGFGVWLL